MATRKGVPWVWGNSGWWKPGAHLLEISVSGYGPNLCKSSGPRDSAAPKLPASRLFWPSFSHLFFLSLLSEKSSGRIFIIKTSRCFCPRLSPRINSTMNRSLASAQGPRCRETPFSYIGRKWLPAAPRLWNSLQLTDTVKPTLRPT